MESKLTLLKALSNTLLNSLGYILTRPVEIEIRIWETLYGVYTWVGKLLWNFLEEDMVSIDEFRFIVIIIDHGGVC